MCPITLSLLKRFNICVWHYFQHVVAPKVVIVVLMFGVVCDNTIVLGVAFVAFNIEYTLDGVMDASDYITQGSIQTYIIALSPTSPFF
jgi:hypothetical protein